MPYASDGSPTPSYPSLSLSLSTTPKAHLNFDGAQKTSQVDMRSCSATAARGWGASPARVLAAPRLLRHGPLHISLPAEAAKGGAGRGSKPAKGGAGRGSKIAKGGEGGAKLAGFLRKAHTRVWTVQALAAIQQHTILNLSRTTGFASAKETTH